MYECETVVSRSAKNWKVKVIPSRNLSCLKKNLDYKKEIGREEKEQEGGGGFLMQMSPKFQRDFFFRPFFLSLKEPCFLAIHRWQNQLSVSLGGTRIPTQTLINTN